jgi:hypothetical protein
MKNFTVLGERNTGTHFLQYAMIFNYNINYERLNKHFFGHEDFPKNDLDNTFYLCIVRNPVDWIDSLFKRLHHIPPKNKANIQNFLNNEWYSIYEEGDKNGKEILEDRNIYTKQRYKNIFELRKIKHDYFLNTISKQVKHFMIIKYEDLRDNYENTLVKIGEKFGLKRKSHEIIQVPKYKGTYITLYNKKPVLLSLDVQKFIIDHIDLEQEQHLGYLLDN